MTESPNVTAAPLQIRIQQEVTRQLQRLAPVVMPGDLAHPGEIGAAMPPLGWGEILTFGQGGTGGFLLREGWSVPEDGFVWSDGPSASLLIPLESRGTDALLAIEAFPFTDATGEQQVRVFAEGTGIGIWTMREIGRYHAIIPAHLLARRREVRLTFQIGRPVSPRELGRGQDFRQLGLALRRLEARPF